MTMIFGAFRAPPPERLVQGLQLNEDGHRSRSDAQRVQALLVLQRAPCPESHGDVVVRGDRQGARGRVTLHRRRGHNHLAHALAAAHLAHR
eukprot:CAMPEP_0167799116 /NCGR_PEP_ID=MMETSP0111_2-20121227/16778_1 /TAXON_ID=91324 /ORGANISM="Lotharella globosa, Strain CCCM811" /LENGTH=90 /DNA_ID=CAMNT_0007693791 /DNA_START=165 /DNA_END=434 /DNA_ORIENTATION=+